MSNIAVICRSVKESCGSSQVHSPAKRRKLSLQKCPIAGLSKAKLHLMDFLGGNFDAGKIGGVSGSA